MAYSTNPNLPKARAIAMKLLIAEKLPLLVVANRCGVHRTTIWRWKKKWDEINKNVQLSNYGRPSRNRNTTSSSRLAACSWRIPTTTSKPHHHPWTLPDELVQTDTIHHVNPYTGRRLYYYTAIDLYTRMAYSKISTKLRPSLASLAVLEA